LIETRSSQSISTSIEDFIVGKLAAAPEVTVNSPIILCAAQNEIITATPSPAGTYSFVWTVPLGVTDPGNVASFSTSIAGTYSVIATNSDGCPTASVSGIVTVITSIPVVVNCSPNTTQSACAYAEQAALNTSFNAWLDGFTASGRNGTLVPLGLSDFRAPNLCSGGSVTVNFSASDSCGKQASCSANFTLTAAPAVTVNAPANASTSAWMFADHVAVNAAFATWLTGFRVSGGCNATRSYGTPTAPVRRNGGTTTGTYTVNDLCNPSTAT